MELLEKGVNKLLTRAQERKKMGRGFDVEGFKRQMEELEEFMKKTREENVDIEVYKIREENDQAGLEENTLAKKKRGLVW